MLSILIRKSVQSIIAVKKNPAFLSFLYFFYPLLLKINSFLIHCILIPVSLPSPPISFPPPLSRSTFSLEKNVFLRDINQTTTSRLDMAIQQNGKSLKNKHINQRLTCLHTRESHKNTDLEAIIYMQRACYFSL